MVFVCPRYLSCETLHQNLFCQLIINIFVVPSSIVDFTNKQIQKERPEDLDVPAALADMIHQQRTQEHVDDM